MKLRTALLSLAAPALFAGCPGSSELVPFFESFEGLPGLRPATECAGGGDDCCLADRWCLDVQTLSVRNVGSRTVTIDSVSFEDTGDAPGGAAAFSRLEAEPRELDPGEQTSVRFRYTTPGGEAQAATLVILSDADVNPRLEISATTLAYTPPGENDAGPGESDAGPNDAGALDAGLTDDDAGLTDDDAG